jgi:branched-chain amino acid transport system substrate-binding protein
MKTKLVWRALVVSLSVALLATACGDDSADDSTGSSPTTTAGNGDDGGGEACAPPDTSIDATDGTYAGWTKAALECAAASPMKATGEPVVWAYDNLQGDPAASFPDLGAGALAAIDFINNELGGIGGDPTTGKPGRPIKLETCYAMLTPASSTSCANELASKKPQVVFEGLQFFADNAYPVYRAAGIPVVDAVPVGLGDFSGDGVYSLGTGGGCVGFFPMTVWWAVYGLDATSIASPWSNSPPGVVCQQNFHDNVLDLINGTLGPAPEDVEVRPDVSYTNIPIAPGKADLSAEASQILASKPDAIIWIAPVADCFNMLSALANQGWTNDEIPMIFSSGCIDSKAIEEAGDVVKGVYFIGGPYNLLAKPTEQSLATSEIELLQEKLPQYQPDQPLTVFEATQFQTILTTWIALQNQPDAASLTPQQVDKVLAESSNYHQFAGPTWGCADAPESYQSICNPKSAVTQWTGTEFETVKPTFDATYLSDGAAKLAAK